MTQPDFEDPRALLRHLYDVAVQRALPLHNTAAHLPAPPQGRTLVLISHRTSLLALVDRIIVMDAGRVVADGPKEQVVQALRQGRIGKAV